MGAGEHIEDMAKLYVMGMAMSFMGAVAIGGPLMATAWLAKQGYCRISGNCSQETQREVANKVPPHIPTFNR